MGNKLKIRIRDAVAKTMQWVTLNAAVVDENLILNCDFTLGGKFNVGSRTDQTIDEGAITYQQFNTRLESASGTSDTLSTINGGVDGDIIIIQAKAGHTITVDENGNIKLEGSSIDLVQPADNLTFKCNGTNWEHMAQGIAP